MKKLLFLILIMFIFSCVKKEEIYYYACTVPTVPGYPAVSIKTIEKSGISSTTVIVEGITIMMKSTYIYTKQ